MIMFYKCTYRLHNAQPYFSELNDLSCLEILLRRYDFYYTLVRTALVPFFPRQRNMKLRSFEFMIVP